MFGIFNKYKAKRIRERMSDIEVSIAYLKDEIGACNKTIDGASSRCDGNKNIREQQMKEHPNVRDRDLQDDITWDHKVMTDNEMDIIDYTEKINEYKIQYSKLEERLDELYL
jgi:chromosome segregation ATPase